MMHQNVTAQGIAAPDKTRIAWGDTARGVGICLVVFGHAWRGVQAAGPYIPERLYSVVEQVIYAFHMPLFFLLSGLFASFVARPDSLTAGIWDRAVRLLYPMLIWSTLFTGARILAGNLANRQVPIDVLWQWPFARNDQFWFLWALFLIQVAVLFGHRLLIPVLRREMIWSVLLAASVAVYVLVPPLFWGNPATRDIYAVWGANAVKYAPFFLFGAAFATAIRRWSIDPVWSVVAAVGMIALGLVAIHLELAGPQKVAVALAMSLCVLALVQSAHRIWPGAGVLDLLGELGRASMAIFVAHTIFSAALRIVMLNLGIDAPILLVPCVAGIGVMGPFVLLRLTDRVGMARWAGLR